eukprot:6187936-Pleurochrysis_carterae.AAC.1
MDGAAYLATARRRFTNRIWNLMISSAHIVAEPWRHRWPPDLRSIWTIDRSCTFDVHIHRCKRRQLGGNQNDDCSSVSDGDASRNFQGTLGRKALCGHNLLLTPATLLVALATVHHGTAINISQIIA